MTLAKSCVLLAAAVAPAVAVSQEKSEPTSPIIKVVAALEKADYGPFIEVSLDDGVWEVEVYKGDESVELRVDPKTYKVLSEHRDDSEPRPPKDALPLSKVLRELHKAGYADVDEVSFERRYWEVETFQDGDKHELHVDPRTAKVISDRIDD